MNRRSFAATAGGIRRNALAAVATLHRSSITGRFRHALAGVVLASVAACASVPSVRAEYDRQVDFSRYRTFGFFDVVGTDRAGYETLVTQTLKAATRKEMEARGYVYAEDNPELKINFNANLTDRIHVSRTPLPPSEYYGYRSYATWRAYDVEVDQFKEGTLNIDVVDAARAQLVWEGIATGPVTTRVYRNREAAIEQAVQQIFREYPFSAHP
jgi:uncharacterized protein DUF4136